MRCFNLLKTRFTFAGIAGLVIFNFVSRAATITWTNIAGGNWSVAANWTPNAVPGASDLALITNNGVYSVVLNISPSIAGLTLGGTSGTQTLSMNGQTLSLNGPLTVNPNGAYTLDSGGLIGNTNAVLTGTLNWVNGSPGGTLTLSTGSTLNITSANDHNMPGCTFTNNGTVAWSSGRIRGGGSGTAIINNGLWNSQADLVLNDDLGVNNTVFNNFGTFRKSASAGGSTIVSSGVLFNQLGGQVDVQAGTFALQGGANLTGGFVTTNQSGVMVLSSGNFNFNGTVTSSNTVENAGNLVGNNVIRGQLTWSGGNWSGGISVTIASNTTVFWTGGGGNLSLFSCLITNYGTVAWINGYPDGGNTPGTIIYNYGLWDCQGDYAFRDDGGGSNMVFNNYGTFRKSVTAGGSTTATTGVSFNQFGGQVDVQAGTFALQGGGSLNGGFVTTNQSGSMVLSAGSFNINGTVTSSNTVENAGNLVGNNIIRGQLTWSGGNWIGGISVTIASNSTVFWAGGGNNLPLYSCLLTNYGTVTWINGYPDGGNSPGTIIYNYGLWDCRSDFAFRNDGGGSNTVFNNYGTFRKSASTGGSTLATDGVLFNQLGGQVDVQAGTFALQGGGNLNGGFVTTNQSGAMVLSAGSFSINGAVTSSNTIENAGNLIGNNIIRGQLTWAGGNWNGGITVTIASNSTVFLAAAAAGNLPFYSCQLTNYGTVAWIDGYPDGGNTPGTMIYNYGLWDCQSDYSFRNDGAGANTVFNNYGTFRKSAGSPASQTAVPSGTTINNFGEIDAQAGWLALQGGFNLTNGTINFGISGPGNYGKIQLSGAANLSGTVSANLNNGYLPINGNSFTNLFYGSLSGIFTNALLPFADSWTTNYLPTYFVLNVKSARPVLNALPTNTFVVNELTLLSVTNTAADSNNPPLTLTYSLAKGISGMAVTASTGIFTWTPPQANSPSTNTVAVAVTDNGTPTLSATNTFTVIVREVNQPPTLP